MSPSQCRRSRSPSGRPRPGRERPRKGSADATPAAVPATGRPGRGADRRPGRAGVRDPAQHPVRRHGREPPGRPHRRRRIARQHLQSRPVPALDHHLRRLQHPRTVLKRDGTSIVTNSSCYPTSGRWYSPYDGATWTAASDLDIDHMVPLAEAWASGAWAWTTSRRQTYANDLGGPELWAVTDNVNQSKSDKDPAEWQPPRRVPLHLRPRLDPGEVVLRPHRRQRREERPHLNAQHLLTRPAPAARHPGPGRRGDGASR